MSHVQRETLHRKWANLIKTYAEGGMGRKQVYVLQTQAGDLAGTDGLSGADSPADDRQDRSSLSGRRLKTADGDQLASP